MVYKKKSIKKTYNKKKSIKKTYNKKKSIKKTYNKKKSSKKSGKKSNKKCCGKKGGGELTELLRNLSDRYKHFDLYKKKYERDMKIKHPPIIQFDDIKDDIPYQSSNLNMGLHIGQRKLLLSEVQFLTYHETEYCIYAGSAPGHKTHYLSQLFPNIKFILVDPNQFDLVLADIPNNSKITHRHQRHDDITHIYYEFPTKSDTYLDNKKIKDYTMVECTKLVKFIKNSKQKIFIIEDYMNEKISNIFKKIGKTVFISDVRSSIKGTPNDFDIIWNTAMVYNWINVLKPEYTMVKFRVPYYNHIEDMSEYKNIYSSDFDISKKYGTDFLGDYKNKVFKMSKCELYLQTWKGSSSTEMRGYISKKNINNIITYNITNIEDKLCYYNKINRMCYHMNPNASKELHFCNCNDCAIENNIWETYTKKIKSSDGIIHYIKISDKITSRPLSKVHTINVYDTIDYNKLKEMADTENRSTKYQNKSSQRGNKGIERF
jgi:hypothetical protein